MRQMRPFPAGDRRPALVLGGGGAYGVIQAAYIQAAYEAGFRPSIIVGTSVGSLNGAWLALHPDHPDELLRIWLGMDRLRLVELRPWRLATRLVRRPLGLVANDIVPRLVREHLHGLDFSDARLPLGVVATNLTRGEKRVFSEGDLGTAIMASTAIPGVFEPVDIDGDLYVDGCLTASVDLATALTMGASEILAIDLTPPPSLARPRTVLGVLRQSLGIMAHATTEAMEACVSHSMPVRVVRPDLSKSSPWRLDDSAGAIAHNLLVARKEMSDVLQGDGSVRAHDGAPACALPEAPAEPVTLRRYFHLRARKQAG